MSPVVSVRETNPVWIPGRVRDDGGPWNPFPPLRGCAGQAWNLEHKTSILTEVNQPRMSPTRQSVLLGIMAPLVVLGTVCAQDRRAVARDPDVRLRDDSTEAVLEVEDFDSFEDTPWGTLPSKWWLEGEAGGASARIHDGRLEVDATRNPGKGATVWFDRELPERVEISFDVQVLDAIDLADNMNLFVHFRDPDHAWLRDSREERSDGAYPNYHNGRLEGNIITHVANGMPDSARMRVRQVPPLDPLLQEFRGYHARAGHTYHVVVTHRGDRITYEVDGTMYLDAPLPPRRSTEGGGYLGFRTWNTRLWWDNLSVVSQSGE